MLILQTQSKVTKETLCRTHSAKIDFFDTIVSLCDNKRNAMGSCFSQSNQSHTEQEGSINLAQMTFDSVTRYSDMFKGKVFTCKVVDVYDGDTCTVIMNINEHQHNQQASNTTHVQFTIRLLGIDTAEMTDKSHKHEALEARDMLIYHTTGIKVAKGASRKECRELLSKSTKCTQITCDTLDKYGRLLGSFSSLQEKGKTVNEILLREKLAKPYFGGKKE